MKILNYLIYVLIFFSIQACCKLEKQLINTIKNSATEEVDLFLIPNPYNIIEEDWILHKNYANFNLLKLEDELKKYGNTLENLKKTTNVEIVKDVARVQIGGTSHYTNYDYDVRIPLVLIGSKWIKSGQYSDQVSQQNIVPTLSKILNAENPNGVEAKELQNIYTNTKEKPKLILHVVIDQGGTELFDYHNDSYPIIKKLFEEGAHFTNVKVAHLDSQTAVGHAAIGTGAFPRKNGIIGNKLYFPRDGKIVGKSIYRTPDGTDPGELKSETFADTFDLQMANDTVVISQSYATRAALGMAGHGSYLSSSSDKDIVYWMSEKTADWETEEKYYLIPGYLKKYNAYKFFKTKYPKGFGDLNPKSQSEYSKKYHYQMAVPKEAEYETDVFLDVVKNELILTKKGFDNAPDLLYLNLKVADASGHAFGFESIESREVLEELDKQIGKVYNFFTQNFKDDFIFVLTADHGCAPVPEFAMGSRLLIEEIVKEVNLLLPKEGEAESLIKFLTVGQIALNRSVLKKYNISREQIIQKLKEIKKDNKYFFKDIIDKNKI